MRLSKATKEFNIATQRAVDTLKEHGHVVEASPNAKIDDAQYEILKKVFASDKAQKDEAEKLFPSRREEKRNEKADKPEVNDEAPAAPAETPAPAAETSTEAQPAAEATKTEVPEDLKPQVKVLGKIELEDNAGGKKRGSRKTTAASKTEKAAEKSAPVEKPEAAPAAAESVAPEAPAEKPAAPAQPAAEKQTPATETAAAPAEAPAPAATADAPAATGNENDAETTSVGGAPRLTGPKVVGKIDLDAINANTRPKKKSKEELRKERNDKRNPAGKKRARIGNERVDVSAEAKKNNAGGNAGAGASQNRNNQNRNNQNAAKGQGKKGKKGNAPAQPVSDEDVAKQVKETLARLAPARARARNTARRSAKPPANVTKKTSCAAMPRAAYSNSPSL